MFFHHLALPPSKPDWVWDKDEDEESAVRRCFKAICQHTGTVPPAGQVTTAYAPHSLHGIQHERLPGLAQLFPEMYASAHPGQRHLHPQQPPPGSQHELGSEARIGHRMARRYGVGCHGWTERARRRRD